jgi:hypothetical protein
MIYAGNSIIPIEEFGSVKITIQASEGPCEIILTEIAFISLFHTNLIYESRAYPLIPKKKIPRTQKLQPRAHIGYLVDYESA